MLGLLVSSFVVKMMLLACFHRKEVHGQKLPDPCYPVGQKVYVKATWKKLTKK